MPEPKLLDVYWMAGLLEGEGCFDGMNQTTPRLRITMTDLDVMIKAGKILGAYNITMTTRSVNKNKPAYYIGLHGLMAIEWMKRIYPLMGNRRKEQIKKCFAKWDERKNWTGRRKQKYKSGPKLSSPHMVWINLDSEKEVAFA